jgi:hypothetical protein
MFELLRHSSRQKQAHCRRSEIGKGYRYWRCPIRTATGKTSVIDDSIGDQGYGICLVPSVGIPNHPYYIDREEPSPNPVCLSPITVTLPANPTRAEDMTAMPFGIIGVLKTGGFVYNHLAAGNVVANHERMKSQASTLAVVMPTLRADITIMPFQNWPISRTMTSHLTTAS